MNRKRNAEIIRKTNETDIKLRLMLDTDNIENNTENRNICDVQGKIDTGCGFLNHMLELFSRHGRFGLDISCRGDTFVDYHHTTEDIGICLGEAFKEALGEKKGIIRYGHIILPMDESLIMCAADFSGRGMLCYDVEIPAAKVGDFDTELCEEFFNAFASHAGCTLHIRKICGTNSHHIIEGVFKAVSRTLNQAVSIDVRHPEEIPSTKGKL